MLPKDLLVTVKRKGFIKPKYLQDTKLAEELIEIFKKYEGKKYKELQEEIENIENNYNYKVVRGLAILLERRCEFEERNALDGKEIRKFLFDRGFVVDDYEREKILEEAEKFFKVSKKEIEEAIFSDLKEEQIIKKFYPFPPINLIKNYNLSLTQTLLFDALELNFVVEGNYQQIFRRIKYLGLMYEIEDNEIKVTGPASLFKKTRKYGTSIAKLIPSIINANKWKIKAKIEIKGKEPKIYDFEITSHDNILLPTYVDTIIHFDSQIEEKFYNDFKSANIDWEIKREPTIIKAKNYVIIPDFGFYKNGMKHYLEIVGFWTPEYLKKKIWKLKNANVSITVAVNQNLCCQKEDFLEEVIFYNNKIPIKPIVKILKKLEEKHFQIEMQKLKKVEINEEIVSIDEKAKELKVSPETIRRLKIPNYFIIGNKIVAKKFLEKLEKEIGKKIEYEKAEEILRKYGLTTKALDYMGYKIKWNGLIPVIVEKE